MNYLELYGIDKKRIEEIKEIKEIKDDSPNYIARVLACSRGIYRVISDQGEMNAEISGKMEYEIDSEINYPAVGDYVVVDRNCDKNGKGIISQIIPRRSVFIRKASGVKTKPQVVAANIDIIFICMSLNQNYNIRRLERYLSLVWESGAVPVIVLTKTDLCDDYLRQYHEVESVALGVDIVGVSSLNENGYQQVEKYLQRGKTIALIGSSGVGKSTLINFLIGKDVQNTREIGNSDKGKHTTTRRELMLLPQGALMIDTPGMRELGMWEAEEGLEQTFSDIDEYAAQCRFTNCSHTNEPGCAIRNAIKNGAISEDRFLSYFKLKSENQYISDKTVYMKNKKEKFKSISKINKSRR